MEQYKKRSTSDEKLVDQVQLDKLMYEISQKTNFKVLPEQRQKNELLTKLEQEFGISINLQRRPQSDAEYSAELKQLQNNPPGINIKFNIGTPKLETPSRLPYILDESQEIHKGRLKFFDEIKNYGFIIMDSDGTDVFVHYDDLSLAGVNIEKIRTYQPQSQVHHIINFSKNLQSAPYLQFKLMTYLGKYNKSRKAIEIKLI